MDHLAQQRTRTLARALAGVAALAALAALAGYAFGLPDLVSLHQRLQGMSPLTTLAIWGLAYGLIAASRDRERLANIGVLVTIVVVAVVLASHLLAGADVVSPALTGFVFGVSAGPGGRMSTGAAITLLLVATGVAARHRPRYADFAAGLGLVITTTALLGYLYDIDDLHTLPLFSTMALETAFALAFLCIATLLVEPSIGWSSVLLSSRPGAGATRRLLGLLLLPAFVGWLLREATIHQHLGTGSALALLVVLTVAPMALLVLRYGRVQVELDRERRGNALARQTLAGDLERRLARKSTELEREGVERSKVEAAMYRSQRVEAMGQLTGGIAHDFNNLLAAIGGNLELLLRKLPEGHVARRHALTASTAVGKGARLAGQLLAFSRSQRLAIRPIEVAPALMRAREPIRNALGPAIELLLEYSRDGLWTRTDPDQLELAILNLALNARAAMPEGGQLRIESGLRRTRLASDDRVRDYASIRVIDTGVGMSPEVLAKAIEPFFTTREHGKGIGLGLAQVYGFVRQCHGDLEMQSTPGEGTSVEILLPRIAPPVAEDVVDTPVATKAGTPDSERPRLLVIDDDDAVRGVLVDLLGDAGYEVSAMNDGASALARIDAIRPHAAVIDFLMPGMNGAEVARHVQARMPALPIVFVSGYHDTAALDGIAGAVVLRKPFEGAQLQRAVAEALERRVEA